jgi:hypothetical protein
MTRIILILIVTCGLLKSYSQTCIIVYAEQNRITVAADSKAKVYAFHDENGVTTRTLRDSLICKIIYANNLYFSYSNITDPGMIELIKQECYRGASFSEKVENCKGKLIPYLTELVAYFKKSPSDYNQKFKDGKICNVLLYCFEQGTSRIICLTFKNRNNISKPVDIYCIPSDENFNIIGDTDGIALIPEAERKKMILESNNIGETMRFFIQKQIDSTPDLVGKPIVIMEIARNNSAHWIGDKGVCN